MSYTYDIYEPYPNFWNEKRKSLSFPDYVLDENGKVVEIREGFNIEYYVYNHKYLWVYLRDKNSSICFDDINKGGFLLMLKGFIEEKYGDIVDIEYEDDFENSETQCLTFINRSFTKEDFLEIINYALKILIDALERESPEVL